MNDLLKEATNEATDENEQAAQETPLPFDPMQEDAKDEAAEAFLSREEALKAREEALFRRELRAEAADVLEEKKLPRALLEVLNYDSRESCLKTLGDMEKAFREAVRIAVESRLRGETPRGGKAPASPDSAAGKMRRALGLGDR